MALDQDINRLARTRPFSLLPRDALKLVAFSAERRVLAVGETLFEQDDVADCGYFVLSGQIVLTVKSNSDGASQDRVIGPDCVIGELALLGPSTRGASARVASATTVLKIRRDVIARVLAEYPGEAAKLHALVAERVRTAATDLDQLRRRSFR
jgi:CRP-like cAMP-binding protein